MRTFPTLLARGLVLVVAVAAVSPAALRAQALPPVASAPPIDWPRVDLSAAVGWFSGTVEHPAGGASLEGDPWFHDAASFSVHAGFYWTENLKLEASAGWGGTGRAWSGSPLLDRAGRPYYVSTEHSVTTSTVSAAVLYQFGHNLTLHPFVGAGVDVDFVRERRLTMSYGDPAALYPPPVGERVERTRARLLVVAGAKAYVSERLFVRADVQAGGAGSARKVIPRVGLGLDF